jgi:hypothetical protein
MRLEPALFRSYQAARLSDQTDKRRAGGSVDAVSVYELLQRACETLEKAGDYGIAASVSYSMSLVREKYGVGEDRYDPPLDG